MKEAGVNNEVCRSKTARYSKTQVFRGVQWVSL